MAETPPLQRSHSIEMPSLLADLPIDNSSVFSKCALDAPHKAHKIQAHWALFAQPKDCPILNITSKPTIAPLEALIKAKNDENRKENGDGNDDEPPALLDGDDCENEESMVEIVPDEDEEMDDDEDSDDSSTSHLEDGEDGPPPLEENSDDSPQRATHRQCRH
ncbi:hypothetical protein RvY_11752 [Ramazzottius varieornatus]|uniref:Uncharacterized protein n=1 Tax=Ramazzottius varieornatus TaxID=947166 RepID=A0A1D1VLH1_RAMVA|nr:hypothetical protein RvY_11752 [Ramazzottius varieornatus]